jgi:hypothetical protein
MVGNQEKYKKRLVNWKTLLRIIGTIVNNRICFLMKGILMTDTFLKVIYFNLSLPLC